MCGVRALRVLIVRDFSFVSFVFFVSCYFETRETRETIGTGARSGIRGRAVVRVDAAVRCPRLRCRLFRLFRLSGLLFFWDDRDKRDDRDKSEVGYQR